ncbi:MAG: rhodanese-like domain-containing protein [Planctomycetota bacterium]
MRFVGWVAIIVLVSLGAAVAHSMIWEITTDPAAALAEARAQGRAAARPPAGDGASQPGGDSGGDSGSEVADPTDPIEGDRVEGGPGPAADVAGADGDADLPDYYVSIARARELWDEGYDFIDARTDREREIGWVEGSYQLETRNFIDGSAFGVLAGLSPELPIIVYCDGGECDASENVALRLQQNGFTDIYIMHEGFPAWAEAGHPVEMPEGGP